MEANSLTSVHIFDYTSTLRLTLNKMFDRFDTITLHNDNKSLYDEIVGIGATNEEWLLIDLRTLYTSYMLRELSQIVWIPSNQNLADAATRDSASPALLN